MITLIALAALSASSSAASPACDRRQPDLLVCPAPQPPRVTELASGSVTLELTIGPTGSVTAIRTVRATGHPAWVAAARTAVAQWRYKSASAVRVRSVPFSFVVAE